MSSTDRARSRVWHGNKRPSLPGAAVRAPLGDDRFNSLLAQANAFFAEAERDTVAERAAVIEDILNLMREHGLSVDDLTE